MALRRTLFLLLITLVFAVAGCVSDGPEYPDERYTPEQLYNLGVDYLNGGQFDLAERQFVHAIQIKPDYGDAHMALANTYYYEAKVARARKDIKVAIQLLNGAIYRFQSAIKLKPTSPEPYMGLALVHLEEPRFYKEALADLQTALAMDPTNKEKNLRCHFYLGAAYGLTNEPEKSAKEYSTYLEQFPGAPDFDEVEDILEDNYKKRGLVYKRIERNPQAPAAVQPGNQPVAPQKAPEKPPAKAPAGKTDSRPRR